MLATLLRECPTELEADLRSEFGVSLRRVREEGVAHVAALASALLVPGTRVAGHFGAIEGWGRQEQLMGALLDDFRDFCWGLGGGNGARPRRVLPVGADDKRTTHKGVAIPVEEFDRLFGIGEGDAWQRQ